MNTDTLDQIIAKALEGQRLGSFWVPIYTAAVRDALLAEGELARRQTGRDTDHAYEMFPDRDWMDAALERVLVIPLLVGVGCGNAKKDAP